MCCFVLACEVINDISKTETLVGGKFSLDASALCTTLYDLIGAVCSFFIITMPV